MLSNLSIQNYALIDQLSVDFGDTLNIITGETGAGKSIILGALSLILGQRADTSVLKNDNKKCIIEGQFDIANYKLQALFENNDLDYEAQTFIRREILPSGKSRAFVNDTPVNLSILKEIANSFADVNTQHQKFSLSEADYQLYLLDVLANQTAKVDNYKEEFKSYTQSIKKLNQLKEQLHKQLQESDFIQFQLAELADANLDDVDEQNNLEKELSIFKHAEKLTEVFNFSLSALQKEELSVVAILNEILSKLRSITTIDEQYEKLASRFESSLLELEDLSSQLEDLYSNVESDPAKQAEIETRLDLLNRLQVKHNVNDLEALMAVQDKFRLDSSNTTELEKTITDLELSISKQQEDLTTIAIQLSDKRKSAAKKFEKKILASLSEVGFSGANISFHQNQTDKTLSSNGIDDYELLFAANAGSKLKAVYQVASGGELSRLMLCIKNLIADKVSLPTIIFDEIDAGISGETASKVADKILQLSNNHQVICITHLPQMASKGNYHFEVYKEQIKGNTFTKIKQLNKEERVEVIAKLLGGDSTGAKATENAKALLTIS